jgi:hypothetical protein
VYGQHGWPPGADGGERFLDGAGQFVGPCDGARPRAERRAGDAGEVDLGSDADAEVVVLGGDAVGMNAHCGQSRRLPAAVFISFPFADLDLQTRLPTWEVGLRRVTAHKLEFTGPRVASEAVYQVGRIVVSPAEECECHNHRSGCTAAASPTRSSRTFVVRS